MRTEARETLTEALQKSRLELWEEKARRAAGTKGKATATARDEEEEAEFRRQIEDIDVALRDIRDAGRDAVDKGQGTRPRDAATVGPGYGSRPARTPAWSGVTGAGDEEPVWNPFTSSYAYRETGFEPGPSGRSGGSRRHGQRVDMEQEVSGDAGLGTHGDAAGSSPVWTQHSAQPVHKGSRHIPEEPVEVYARVEALRTGSPTSMARKEGATEGVGGGNDQSSQVPRGRFAYIGNVVQSWMAPGLGRWFFGAKSTDDATNQASPDRTKDHSRVSSANSSKSAATSLRAGLSSASLTSTKTPRSSLSSGSSKRHIVRRLQQSLKIHRSPSHSDGACELAKLRAKVASPIPAPFVSSHEHEPPPLSESLRQSLREPLFPSPQEAQQQQQRPRVDQECDPLGHLERAMRQSWPEDETLLLALSLEEETQAQRDGYELSRRMAMQLQVQEDREMAERQEILETEWLQEEIQAVLEPDRRAAAEAEAQEAVLRADGELAARLSDSDRAILSDREYAEQLQAQMEREDALEFLTVPPMTSYGEQRSIAGSMYGGSPMDHVRTGTQQSQPRTSNDRALAKNVHEEEKKRAAREDEKTRSEISAWQNKAEQGDEGECVSCTDSFPKNQLVRPCEHFYCRGCLAGKATLPSHQDSPRRGLTAHVSRIVPAGDEREAPAALLQAHTSPQSRVPAARRRLRGGIHHARTRTHDPGSALLQQPYLRRLRTATGYTRRHWRVQVPRTNVPTLSSAGTSRQPLRGGQRYPEGGGDREEEGVETLSALPTSDREDGGMSPYEMLAVQDGLLLELFEDHLQWELSPLKRGTGVPVAITAGMSHYEKLHGRC